MIALDILNEINEQINKSSDYDFIVEVHFNKAYQLRVKKAIKELEDIKQLLETFDEKMPKGDMEFKIEIVEDLNQVVMENFK